MSYRTRPDAPTDPAEDAAASREALRQRAEEKIAAMLRSDIGDIGAEDLHSLIHELSVHQIELEMQNEQLVQTHAALEASRGRYFDLYDKAPVAYITLRLGGGIVEANRLAATLLGVPKDRLTDRRLTDFMLPKECRYFIEQHTQLLALKEPKACVLHLVRPNGTRFWAQLQMTLVLDRPSGTPLCRAALSDISDRVRMQEDIARLAAIVASSDDAIISRDLEGKVTSWNAGAERLFGYTAEEMLGCTLEALVPLDRRSEELEVQQRVRRGESVSHFDSERLTKDARVLPVSLSLSPIRDDEGHIVGTSKIVRDVSDRASAHRALQRRLRQLDLLSQTGQALIMLNDASPAMFRDMFDRASHAIGADMYLHYRIGAIPETLELESSSGLSAEQVQYAAVLRFGETLCGTVARRRAPLVIENLEHSEMPEADALRAAGVRCYAGFPLLARGVLLGVAAFATTTHERFDVGDLPVVRTVCDQVSATLERLRLFEELRANERTLKEADRKKDDFIATLAHELRNPLAPIRNAVGILRHGGPPGAQKWCQEVIERQVVQMTRLLEDLLDVSRIMRNKIALRCDRIELVQVIEQALEATRPLIDAQGHDLAVDLPQEPVLLYGDLTRLTQVFANLLNNAAKYTEPGGRIELTVERQDDEVMVCVRDSGIGIDPEHLPSVFTMFAQLSPALERASGGLGIGLSIARALVESHGGSIEARSAGRNQGSEFAVRLPVLLGSAEYPVFAAPGEDAREDVPPVSARRIMIVDDNMDVALSLGALLTQMGHEVRTAANGRQGLELAEEYRPDAAILDVGMPELNGYDLCRRIREQPWGERMLLIACTGWGQTEDRVRAQHAGFDYHVVKPAHVSVLLKLLARAGAERPGA
jgi:PAS domain S-box-containing protein